MKMGGKLRQLTENLGGICAVVIGVSFLMILFPASRSSIGVQLQSAGAVQVQPIQADAISGADLQKRLDDIATKKQAIEAARLAKIRAAQEAAREKAAKEKAAREKAAREKAAREKAAREKAAKEKAAEEKAKLAAIADVPTLSELSSYDVQATAAAISAFRQIVKEKMHHVWRPPPDILGDLHAQLFIRFDRQGRVILVKVNVSSGYPLFDAEAIRAVKAASPLPLPGNQEARETLINEGVLFNFNP